MASKRPTDKGSQKPTETPAKLAEDLHRWLTTTMKFKGYGKNKTVPTVEDLKTLMKGPNNLKIWRHVVQNVLPSETVKKIRGNLMLSSNQAIVQSSRNKGASNSCDDEELNELLKRKNELNRELSETEKFNSTVERELESIKKEFATNGRRHKNMTQDVTDDSCLRRATEGVTERIKRDEETVKEMFKYIEERFETLEKLMRSSSVQSSAMQSSKERDGSDSNCMTRLRECLFLSERICQRHLLGSRRRFHDTSRGGDDNDDVSDQQASLIQATRLLMENHSAEEIIASMARIIGQSNNQLKKLSGSTGAKFSVDKIPTEKNQTSDVRSKFCPEIKQLFDDSKLKTIRTQHRTESALNASTEMRPYNERNKKVVETLVFRRYSERRNCQQAALTLLKVMEKLAISRAAHSSLKSHVKRLSGKIEGIERKQEVLAVKYDKLMILNETVKEKQDLMQVLALENLQMKSLLKQHQKEVIQYVSNNLIGHDEKWIILANQLDCSSVAKEIKVFKQIGFQNYMLLSVDPSQTSIHRSLNNPMWLFSSALLRLMESLKFPHYRNLDDLMPHVTSLHLDLMLKDAQKKSCKSSSTVENYHFVKEIIDELQELSNKVNEKERSHVELYEPMMRNRATNAAQSLVVCQRVKGIVSDWWNLPARTVLPWVKVDDMNMQQWLDKWKINCSMLRQVSLT